MISGNALRHLLLRAISADVGNLVISRRSCQTVLVHEAMKTLQLLASAYNAINKQNMQVGGAAASTLLESRKLLLGHASTTWQVMQA